MEGHLCKLCLKTFSNGRALGGHMRSHLLAFRIPSKDECPPSHLEGGGRSGRLAESASSAGSFSSEENMERGGRGREPEEEGEARFQNYGLRENPRKSIRVADPEFAMEDYDDGSVSVSHLLQDRESETESSKNFTGRRSKRARKSFPPQQQQQKLRSLSEKPFEVKITELSEPASSISEESREEDVAFCLMLLSRDRWKSGAEIIKSQEEDEHDNGSEEEEEDQSLDDTSESDDGVGVKYETDERENRVREKYRCETCNKLFRSYQALGGHRASHKKAKLGIPTRGGAEEGVGEQEEEENVVASCSNKVHECPFCYRVFASGQALGGHKRSHAGNTNYYAATSKKTRAAGLVPKKASNLIDLNLPAPVDSGDDEVSQAEFSALSEAELVNRVRR